jgi:hypothetical protein
MSLKGTIKYSGYKTGGKIKLKGMRNKRRAKLRKIKEKEMKERMARQLAQEEREEEMSNDWYNFNAERN